LVCPLAAQAQTNAVEDTSKMLATAAREKDKKEGLFGVLGLGYLASKGNSENSSLNAQLNLGYLYGRWRHASMLKAIRGSSDGVERAEAYHGTAQSDFTFLNRNYLFAALDSDYDRFGAYLRRNSATTGLGRRFIDTDAHTLDLQVGVGRRWTRRPGEAEEREGIAVGLGKYDWKISDRAAFSQRLVVESGSANTYSESVSAITADIQDSLALSVSYTVRHNSNVPADRKKTDTATAVSVLYGF
jgi:putative salt-induced outer membrane protein